MVYFPPRYEEKEGKDVEALEREPFEGVSRQHVGKDDIP